MRRRGRVRGRLVFPAVDALLVAAVLDPFPRVSMREGRCPTCWGPGFSWNVQQRHTRGGAMAAHHPDCPQLDAAY